MESVSHITDGPNGAKRSLIRMLVDPLGNKYIDYLLEQVVNSAKCDCVGAARQLVAKNTPQLV